MRIPMSGCNRTTSSLSHRDSSRHVGRTGTRRPPVTRRGAFTVRRLGLILALTLGGVGGLLGPGPVWAQTPSPSTPSDPTQQPPGQPPQGQQPQEQAPQQPASPTPEPGLLTPTEQRQLLQQYQQQQALGPPGVPPPPSPPAPPSPRRRRRPRRFLHGPPRCRRPPRRRTCRPHFLGSAVPATSARPGCRCRGSA